MRTRPIGAVSALIALTALVAVAGPAETRAPGTVRSVGSGAFTPIALDRPLDAAIPVPSLDPQSASDATLDADAVVLDPAEPLPSTREAVELPHPRAGVVRKGGPSGGSWRSAAYSWYGPGLYGNGTACGQTLTRTLLGVAHRTLRCGTRVTLRNPKNGRSITVTVIDRGPYVSGRTWDLSRATCSYLGNCYTGTIQWRLP